MNHDYQPADNESGRPGYKIRVRPDKSSAMLTGDPHNPSNLGESYKRFIIMSHNYESYLYGYFRTR